MKPIRDAILSLESSKVTLADCYFSFACLGQSINKISNEIGRASCRERV